MSTINIFISSKSICGEQFEYDDNMNELKRIFLDQNERPVTNCDGFSILLYKYCDNNRSLVMYTKARMSDNGDFLLKDSSNISSIKNRMEYKLTDVYELELYNFESVVSDFTINHTSHTIKSIRNTYSGNK